jgi:hypothetical protein
MDYPGKGLKKVTRSHFTVTPGLPVLIFAAEI